MTTSPTGVLNEFQGRYGTHITKDGVWEYLYGVMHAPDWRERYKHDLQRNLPRVPLADDFEAFRVAGRSLMDLHINYETCEEYPLECLVDNQPDEGDADGDAYRIDKRMRWSKTGKETNRTGIGYVTLSVPDTVSLDAVPIPHQHIHSVCQTPTEKVPDQHKHNTVTHVYKSQCFPTS